MYRAMIVDDEQWVVKNLLDGIEWSRYGFDIIATETQSPRALQLMQELIPDLAFIDIRMPQISGLELIKKCNELQLDTLFIVVSGFAEFSYVQKCMNLGAIGYCLKPIEEEEIIPLLKKAKERLDERSAKDVPSVLEWIVEDKQEGSERVLKLLSNAGFDAASGLRVVVGLDVADANLLRPYRHLKLSAGGGKSMYIATEEDQPVSLYEHLANSSSTFRGIGISGLFHHVAELKGAIEDAEMAAFQYFITGEPTVLQVGESKGFSDFKQLPAALQNRNLSELMALYDQYEQLFRTGCYQIKHAFFLHNTVLTTIIHSQNHESEKLARYLLVDYERLIERYQDIGELIQDLKRMSGAYLGGMYHQGHFRSESFVAVIEYVNNHYHENLSLQMLADEFYMNRNYISQLFIKHVSQSFTDYLAELRVRHACELLRNSNLPIHRVGERAGYPDAYYFSKIFKKIVGKTPREYRASM
ncbi:response regulator [Paenibacillus lignilyticus]|uniref:Response regulator n=1 Tax=Paenibacillus lignilyticus TaxID=1172615 RepID=A0ABS5CI40_9BACL|nr:helix-turn-helix domain-containing protein [Paenibacillus lignilyticus]MBP3965539.1 response regulator [Paenibacillus lignilyticus]